MTHKQLFSFYKLNIVTCSAFLIISSFFSCGKIADEGYPIKVVKATLNFPTTHTGILMSGNSPYLTIPSVESQT